MRLIIAVDGLPSHQALSQAAQHADIASPCWLLSHSCSQLDKVPRRRQMPYLRSCTAGRRGEGAGAMTPPLRRMQVRVPRLGNLLKAPLAAAMAVCSAYWCHCSDRTSSAMLCRLLATFKPCGSRPSVHKQSLAQCKQCTNPEWAADKDKWRRR